MSKRPKDSNLALAALRKPARPLVRGPLSVWSLPSLLALGCALFAQACSTARLSFRSTPAQAEVFAAPFEGGPMKAIGSTPLVISSSEVQAKIGSSGPVIIELRKDGYRDLRFLVTDLAPVDLSISSELQRATGLEDVEKLNAVVDALFEAQRLTRAGRLEDALKEVRFVQKEAPQISASYEIEGGVYYLQKKLPQAFDAYSTAVKQNPRNAEAARMRNYLQTALGLGGKMEPGSGEGRNKAEKPRKSGSSGGRKTR